MHLMFNIFFPPPKFCRLLAMVEKYGTAGLATYDNTEHALCMLDN
jgi:hypothetical protein